MLDNLKTIIDVNELQTSFYTSKGEVKAVDGVSFDVPSGKTLGIVGESGSGKSITSLSIMRLIESPGKVKGGSITFNGEDLLAKSEAEMRHIRGNQISMIFQEPMTSLNPVFTIGDQIAESYMIHEKLSKKEALKKALGMLELVGIPSPKDRLKAYPYELSGGMRQRAMIAIALACNPELLIADEPTTALDVTIQAQILRLINRLQDELGMSMILITHDLGVVAETCDYVAVMYAGKIVEYADVHTLFKAPKHPYTVGLLKSLPRHDIDQDELEVIKGMVPRPDELPEGCRFAPRCPFATKLCEEKLPSLENIDDKNQVRCWIHTDEWDGPEVNVRDDYGTAQSQKS
ncbi:ABC transporter ATP-binding protein [Salipaludibacillus agaradhaerens]|uniref:ABC transporter ATP-binding protein n=1 Tax=Salipaludibacillus agaradhaerens TaxID=76935 RepID=UPI0021516FD7|nr:ABC transporter ATP-binding protein [Salipaludibacillus agaradhaerens]MCR6108353.1 ABC transporter ATP-binding protein [Salipaludibacillus agaradhaerens]MCR6120377.1 ABC transporter ATP-binding protein [Salipaludibacillus agaradhaerens]UJW59386.1 ABC transporter ATP-binding protein [Bacillus sp. A116_S68]